MSELSAKSQTKARRLVEEGRVDGVDGRTFLVRGDHGGYTVTLASDVAHCSCPAFGDCSHLEAARIAAGESAPQEERSTPALEPRRHSDAVGDRIYTASWQLVSEVPMHLIAPVRISVGVARFIPGARGWPFIDELIPDGLLGIKDPAEFTTRYRERLEEYGAPLIQSRFDELHRRFPGQPLVLLCFEPDRADCHRGDFARWFEEKTGVVVPEFTGVDDLPNADGPPVLEAFRSRAVTATRNRGECHLCSGAISVGARIVKLGRGGSWVHLGCAERQLRDLMLPTALRPAKQTPVDRAGTGVPRPASNEAPAQSGARHA